MNWKAMGLTVVASVTLTACANGMNEEANQGLDNGVEQTRFNSTTDYPSYTGAKNQYPYGDTTNVRYGADDNAHLGENTRNNRYQNGSNARLDNNNTADNIRFGSNIDTYRDDDNAKNTRYPNNNDDINVQEINNRTNQTDTKNPNNNARLNTNKNMDEYQVSDQAADRITSEIKQVDSAYVLTTNNNAYVAAEINGNGEVSDRIEQQITQIVKSIDNNIDNVYVSTNPDFVDLSNNYVNDFDNGRPVEGFFDQFGEMVDRIFPDVQ
ncbi:YhcN/YlaJ family sporulation lipoprotein [Radiobacillus sp. PE A8.2]|uniref:YhcN/YlaJ family sporulation lipoprotein n=1 Tax=Radiobacillus sp. PE A8.2 TaxID=3380349 RepID=UPI00388D0FFC